MRNQNGIHHNGRKPFKILADEYVKNKIDKIGGQGNANHFETEKTDEKSCQKTCKSGKSGVKSFFF